MSKSRKVTYSLPESILAEIDRAVASGAANSKNALVERALVRELKVIQREERRRRWEAAVNDPLFLKDLAEVEAAFGAADAETARGIV